MSSFDFVVIGGGIAGVSVAAELSLRAKVLIVERETQLSYHSTGRSAALFAQAYGPPQVRILTRASRDFYETPPKSFSPVDLMAKRGMLLLVAAGRTERLAELAAEFGDVGGRVADVEECLQLVPILRRDQIAGGYYDGATMDLDVDAIHQGFLRQARGLGTIVSSGCTQLRIERRHQGWSVEIDGEEVTATTIVNAAGAWADEVGHSLGARRLDLTPFRRTALLVDPPADFEVASWPAVMDADESYYFKPDAGKLLLSPSDETPSEPCDAQPEDLDVAIAVHHVQQIADLPVRRVNHAWAGLRTFGPDRLPVVGPDPEIDGLFWLAGQGGFEIQTAPAVAKVAAALALGDAIPRQILDFGFDAAALAPGRLS